VVREVELTSFPKGSSSTEPPAKSASPAPKDSGPSLLEARKGFKTKLVRKETANEPLDKPPPDVFQIVQFDAPMGKLAAYLSPAPKDKERHPAIIWITGGDCNTIGDVWKPAPARDDQTAAAYRKAGLIMMFPSLRGGNHNPGFKEGFMGEVDDVLAAADYLAGKEFVDPKRIYLGGHSTGGTLVFLLAAASDRFRAVFSFGPTENVGLYGREYIPFDRTNPKELELRSPLKWVNTVKSPLFVFEGTVQGNLGSLMKLKAASRNPLVHFHPVKGANHFSTLAPVNKLIAERILKDAGDTTNLSFTDEELAKLLGK
jgi:hypothetical protein